MKSLPKTPKPTQGFLPARRFRRFHILPCLAVILWFTLMLDSPGSAGGGLHKEATYQEKWCREARGETEVLLSDKTRVDCLTGDYAIEFDFGSKWMEALGQALHYSLMTQKKPGIVLILEKKKDVSYRNRLDAILHHYHLDVKLWVMRPEDL